MVPTYMAQRHFLHLKSNSYPIVQYQMDQKCFTQKDHQGQLNKAIPLGLGSVKRSKALCLKSNKICRSQVCKSFVDRLTASSNPTQACAILVISVPMNAKVFNVIPIVSHLIACPLHYLPLTVFVGSINDAKIIAKVDAVFWIF